MYASILASWLFIYLAKLRLFIMEMSAWLLSIASTIKPFALINLNEEKSIFSSFQSPIFTPQYNLSLGVISSQILLVIQLLSKMANLSQGPQCSTAVILSGKLKAESQKMPFAFYLLMTLTIATESSLIFFVLLLTYQKIDFAELETNILKIILILGLAALSSFVNVGQISTNFQRKNCLSSKRRSQRHNMIAQNFLAN